jgi:hypothetical protein
METNTATRLTIGCTWEEDFTMRHTDCESGREKNHLHLIGLARIPRCAACRRFEALRRSHAGRTPLTEPLPPVPASCKHEVCRPLVARCACIVRPKS